jgi:HSP20 family molecular chaperone IbpA|nr:Hsp20/alpha crystallin family protein [uncultured Bacillus sp.]
MIYGNKEHLLKMEEIDQWLEDFFLDPLTSYLDESEFRIDLFETAEEFIVEALLPSCRSQDIDIQLGQNSITIEAHWGNNEKDIKQRTISFPFPVIDYKVTAGFQEDVLEIYIFKHKFCLEKLQKVPIDITKI